MASRTFYATKHPRQERVQVFGSFAPNGSSAVANANNEGSGPNGTSIFSVVRNSAGSFTVTMADGYRSIEGLIASIQIAAGLPSGAGIAITAKTTNSFTLVYSVAGTPTDLAAAAGTKINFACQLNNSGVG
jgi:hypothetical protein